MAVDSGPGLLIRDLDLQYPHVRIVGPSQAGVRRLAPRDIVDDVGLQAVEALGALAQPMRPNCERSLAVAVPHFYLLHARFVEWVAQQEAPTIPSREAVQHRG